MLREFLTDNRLELIERCRSKVANRRAPRATPAELEFGVPLFLAQITEMLPAEGDISSAQGMPDVGASASAETDIAVGASMHGRELLRHDFRIDQVVHDYGDLCQSITELAVEKNVPITVHEFGILNSRLDNAIAGAVSGYAGQHHLAVATNERLSVVANEMRNLLNTAILAISAIKRGSVGFGGSTAAALDRSLIAMRGLIDRTLAEVRLEDGKAPLREVIEIAPFIADVQVAAALEASERGCELSVSAVEHGIFVEADRHILSAAVANLLQNAFKYTRSDSHVVLSARAEGGHVFIEVQDECGGLPVDTIEGPGLAITRKGVVASGGTLTARDIPGRGCLFTIDLPQKKWDDRRAGPAKAASR